MLTSPDIRLFSAGPAKTQATGKRGLFGGLSVLGSAQNVFLRETLIIIDIVSLIFVFLIVYTLYEQHSSTATIIGVEAFFLASLVLLLIARTSVRFAAVLAFDTAILVLVLELRETQEQLRREMAHTEELAATRERTRIARDIHDVLAHSLTVLSIQVQAARQLMQQHPERLAAKLDDIATLLRESIAESRRVVGLLRETATPSSVHGDLGQRLQAVAGRFCERTGARRRSRHTSTTSLPSLVRATVRTRLY